MPRCAIAMIMPVTTTNSPGQVRPKWLALFLSSSSMPRGTLPAFYWLPCKRAVHSEIQLAEGTSHRC